MDAILACHSALCTVWVAGRHFRMNKSMFTPGPIAGEFCWDESLKREGKERDWEGEGVGIEALKTLPLSFSLRPSISKFLLHIANGRALMGSGCEFFMFAVSWWRRKYRYVSMFCFNLFLHCLCGWSWLFWDACMLVCAASHGGADQRCFSIPGRLMLSDLSSDYCRR